MLTIIERGLAVSPMQAWRGELDYRGMRAVPAYVRHLRNAVGTHRGQEASEQAIGKWLEEIGEIARTRVYRLARVSSCRFSREEPWP